MTAPLRLSRVSGPDQLPVTLGELKAHLRIEDDQTTDDAVILGFLNAAIRAAEHFTRRALITQTWRLFLDDWPRSVLGGDVIREGFHQGADPRRPVVEVALPLPPLQAVVHVKTHADDDQATLWPAGDYFVDSAGVPGRIVMRKGAALPPPTRVANGIEIQFTAGYGDYPADVPETLRTGILVLAAHLNERRGDDDPVAAARASGAMALWRTEQVFRA